MTQPDLDPKNLIQEVFSMEEIDAAQCRSIFLDWALSLPEGTDVKTALRRMLTQYEAANRDHPMITVMQEGLSTVVTPTRRGGWRARSRH